MLLSRSYSFQMKLQTLTLCGYVSLLTNVVGALKVVDSYFASIGAKDVDDCGKKLVCEIETIDPTKRTVEEMLVRN